MLFPYGPTVTRLRGVRALDPYSEAVSELTWDDPDELPFEQCAVWQEQTMDVVPAGSDLRTQVTTIVKASLPYGADITEADRFKVDGSAGFDGVYEVQGDPWHVQHPETGWTPGCIVTGVRTDG